jgi:DNA-binding MarR family transcriptional regulator
LSMTTKTITLTQVERPYSDDLEESIDWLLKTLGIAENMIEKYRELLLEIIREGDKISATELAGRRGDPRTSVAYHVAKLVDMGLLTREGRGYRLRASTLLRTVEEMERDVLRIFEDMKKVARTIDEALGLPRRR